MRLATALRVSHDFTLEIKRCKSDLYSLCHCINMLFTYAQRDLGHTRVNISHECQCNVEQSQRVLRVKGP
jgi:hypothetical protein